MLVLSKKAPSDVVWTSFFDSGWGSNGTATLVGIIANVIPLLGADAAGELVVWFQLWRGLRLRY